MKGLLENAVIVGCDVDQCPRLLIFNQGADRTDLDQVIASNGWRTLPTPAGDDVVEHACPQHAPPISNHIHIDVDLEDLERFVKSWYVADADGIKNAQGMA